MNKGKIKEGTAHLTKVSVMLIKAETTECKRHCPPLSTTQPNRQLGKPPQTASHETPTQFKSGSN